MVNSKAISKDFCSSELQAVNSMDSDLGIRGNYNIVCRDKNGSIKWIEKGDNLIVNAGLDHSLESILGAGAQITTWYLGLKNTGVPVAADTMASHASWTENISYSNATRVICVFGATSGQSIDNSASTAVFNINATTTIFGAFLVSNSTKGGTTGTLFSVKDFASSRAVQSGDTLTITFTTTQASV